MSKRGAQVLEEALSLPPTERVELVELLLSSLDSPSQQQIDQLWAQEAEDRLDAFERGEIQAVSAQDVFNAFSQQKLE
ncbi:MAG: addiction module protein [Acidobacteria bacterium]|nr:addiction module protein [Acidobacteriota bacterium]MCI0722156.1 addiction module protein [Acidobacteriota bacterium]